MLTFRVLQKEQQPKGLPGKIILHCWTMIPTGVRVLNLEGQVISISSIYAELAAACYCGDSANNSAHGFYKTSDESGTLRNINGTYMVLPTALEQAQKETWGMGQTLDRWTVAVMF